MHLLFFLFTSGDSKALNANYTFGIGTYFPFTAKLCLNGHEYAKRQLEQEGVPYQALDNGFASCADPERLQAICEQLGPEQIDQLLRRWLARLPHPFTRRIVLLATATTSPSSKAEFSLTQILDRPLSGRIFFEEILRENSTWAVPISATDLRPAG